MVLIMTGWGEEQEVLLEIPDEEPNWWKKYEQPLPGEYGYVPEE